MSHPWQSKSQSSSKYTLYIGQQSHIMNQSWHSNSFIHLLEYTSFGLIRNQNFQSRRVKLLQYKPGRRTYSQVPIFICQLHHLCLKSFALLHQLPCFSVIKWNTMWFWHRSILLRCVQYWGRFACIYIILQTARMIWEFTYLEKNHPQLKSETMKLLI